MSQAPNTRDPLGLAGTVLDGKYHVDRVVGEGGAALVYRAENRIWGVPVAIKFFVSLAQAPEKDRQSLFDEFLQEGRIVANLSTRCSAIVQPRDIGVLDMPGGTKLPYLVLEWLDGRSLDEVIVDESRRKIPPRTLHQGMTMLEPIAVALALAHGENVAHRDVKPENMIVVGDAQGPDARIKLLDFGIAKMMQHTLVGVHQTGLAPTAFTPHYGAPEQFSRSYGETGPWTDVFAMALVLLEVMRGGRRAYQGDDYVVLAQQSQDEEHRPTPRALGMQVDDAVESVFARALAVQPRHRYRTMTEFWSALVSAVYPTAPAWAPSGDATAPRLAPAIEPSAPRTAPAAAGSRAPLIGGVIVAVVLVGGVTIFGATRYLGEKGAASAAVSAAPAQSTPPDATSPPSSAAATPSLCPPTSAPVPGGRFSMGADAPAADGPKHAVLIDAFCLDRDEVTAGSFGECVKKGACTAPAATGATRASECTFGREGLANHPINCVTHAEATTYCASVGMRLPTEAEWERAASGSADTPWGDAKLEGRANLDDSDAFALTAPVGSFASGASTEGVRDLIGNAAEWVADFYAPFSDAQQINPRGPSEGEKRVVKGGSFAGMALVAIPGQPKARVAASRRDALAPTARSALVGFRCAKDLAR